MTPQQIELVQTSFRKVVPIAGTAADLFYDRLFETAPEVRSMFPQDMKEQKAKLMGMLGTAVSNLHKLDEILPAVRALGERHKGYGVTAARWARRCCGPWRRASAPTSRPRSRKPGPRPTPRSPG
jgi:hemoglobin-like flavoprotein